MSAVLDASFAIDLIVSTSGPDLAPVARTMSQDTIRVPAFFWHEVASGLRNMVLRDRLARDARGAALQRLRVFRPQVDLEPAPIEEVIGLSDRFQLTIYDAAYLELALRTSSSLATRDGGLATAARKARVKLVSPI